MKLFLFYCLRQIILAYRKQWCWLFGHKMEFTGYWEADGITGKFRKINQCVRCRLIDQQHPGSPCVRFNPNNPYGE
jgi:hypothetical protein